MNNIFQIIVNYFSGKEITKVSLVYKFLFIIFKNFINKKIIINFGKFKFFSYPCRKDLSRWMLKHLKPWDYDQILSIKNILNNSKSLFLDCGSNFGSYSIVIASLCKKTQVISFDASKKMIDRLNENINLNRLTNIEVHNIGIGKKKSSQFFDDDDKNFKNLGSYRFIKKNGKKLISLTSLDSFFKNKNLKKYEKIVIKLDLEGYEFEALQGLKKIIKRFKPIIFLELSKMLLDHKDFSIKKFKKFMVKNNLQLKDSKQNSASADILFDKLKNLNEKQQTIGDYFLLDKNLVTWKIN